ncbi:MAG: hypothetical protein RIC35_18435 [Marinoscillum sp.]
MEIFNGRISEFEQKASFHKKKAILFSTLRGICFIALVVLLIQFFRTDQIILLLFAAAALVAFALLITRHQLHDHQHILNTTLVKVNTEEKERLALNLDQFDPGNEFIETGHPNQEDLDIFGQHSIFQLVNHCALEDSKKLLADWLSKTPRQQEILDRQSCIKELSGNLDWIQEFQSNTRIAVGKKKKQEPVASSSDLINWANIPGKLSNPALLKTIAVVLSTISIGLIILIALGRLPYQYLYGSLLINAIFLVTILSSLHRQIKGIDKAKYMISSYQQCIELIDKQHFEAPLLVSLKKGIQNPANALKGINQLSKLSHRISSRSNMLYMIFDLLFLQDIYLLTAIEQWKNRHKKHLNLWFGSVHEAETLVSIATFAHSHPDFSYPEITDKHYQISGQAIGHPLIPTGQCVPNDYSIDGKGSVDIITGSNMSGKSTFQRTLGVNMVLANIGGPVCAQQFSMSPVEVFTSMRTKDNLEEHTSSFYAELKRIRQLLELVDHRPVFFLLDEILKGTNSEDRHLGAVALIQKLTGKSGFGLISTHDLSLGKLEATEKNVRNFSFNSEIEGDKILFDYRLTPGTCKSFNASQLMRNLGIVD